MNKIWIIIQREYITRVRRKSFVVTTLLAPLGFFLLISSYALINKYSQGRTDVAIIDESGLFKDIAIPDAEDQTVYFHKVGDNYDQLSATLLKEEKSPKFKAIIQIPANFDVKTPNKPPIGYRYVERPGTTKMQFINQSMNDAVSKLRMNVLKISSEQVEQMQQKVTVDPVPLDPTTDKRGYTDAAALVGLFMGFAIYISIFFYGTMIMKGVMEEKTNRVVEILTSSIKPFQLLMGKIVGVGAVGLTQFVLWAILIFIVGNVAALMYGDAFTHQQSAAQMQQIDTDDVQQMIQNFSSLPFLQIALLFPIYFVGGFLLYGSLFAAVGAAMGEDGDQQALMVPITVPIIISIYIAINVVNNPDSGLGFWGSIIPFTSPVVMSALLPFRPEWWQIAISVFLLIAGFVFTTWVAARVYRTGILMYGKKIKLKEIGRWIFANK